MREIAIFLVIAAVLSGLRRNRSRGAGTPTARVPGFDRMPRPERPIAPPSGPMTRVSVPPPPAQRIETPGGIDPRLLDKDRTRTPTPDPID